MLARALLDRLVCPTSKEPLVFVPADGRDGAGAEGWLVAPTARLRYRIESGVPVLLAEEAITLSEDAVRALVTRAEARP